MKRVALINDLSGFGKCSLTAAIPVISVMGIQACPLPTAVLSAQTGFGEYYMDDFTNRMNYFTEQWHRMGAEFDGIYSGYLANHQQMDRVEHFLELFQRENTLYLADPVMGDYGKTYGMFNQEFLQRMRELTRRADVITPNLTELCLLAGEDFQELTSHMEEEDYFLRIKEICMGLIGNAQRKQTVVVTGIHRKKGDIDYIGNLAVSEKECYHAENPYTGTGFSGTGDLFASVICGSLVNGLSIREAMNKAGYFLQDAIEEATAEKIPPMHGVLFEKYLSRLL